MPTESKSETPKVDDFNGAVDDVETWLEGMKIFDDSKIFQGRVRFILETAKRAIQLEKELNDAVAGITALREGLTACTVKKEQVEKELNETKDLLRHFVTHFEVSDYSESTYDEVEKIAVSLWGVVKERNTLAKELAEAKQALEKGREFICIEHGGHFSCPECAKENKVMREALKTFRAVIDWEHYEARIDSDAVRDLSEADTMAQLVLRQPNTTNLIVLTRDELIAEIEKMPCTCLNTSNDFYKVGYSIKCPPCQWLAKLKAT